ncbi:unnamed protein product [Caenorhabditis auriculariae]|uniref:RING-type domain-containing protein n=1 Tax=Caenorhabditis auriculariae TaxID=2777116 RepID=A0A8S1HXK6_9PELO|nr:unnamed protein product [Caenorhabditis auriculariae]
MNNDRVIAQVLQISKCSACDTSLQLPAVHFLCRHSYHVHCFESYSERADRCPACATQNQTRDRDNLAERAAYSKFQAELESCTDNMELIAKYLENGLFDDHRHSKKNDKRASGAILSTMMSRTSSTPFDDDWEDSPLSRTMSSASTVSRPPPSVIKSLYSPAVDDYDDRKNPFASEDVTTRKKKSNTAYDESKNPFGNTPSNNPFDEE